MPLAANHDEVIALRAVVVHRDGAIRQSLCRELAKHPRVIVIAETPDVDSAVSVIGSVPTHLAFVGAQLSGISSLALGRIDLAIAPPVVVAVSGGPRPPRLRFALGHLSRSLAFDDMGTVLQQVGLELAWRYRLAIERSTGHGRLAVGGIGKIHLVTTSDITWISAAHNDVVVHTTDGRSLQTRESMQAILRRLDPRDFLRIHRSVAVSIERISEMEVRDGAIESVTLRTGERFKASVSLKYSRLGIP
jgi:two-component system LytT family response regulator